MDRHEQLVTRRAYRQLDNLFMAALKGPLPITRSDAEESGVPAARSATVTDALRSLQQRAAGGEWGAARREGKELARQWASEWGPEIGSADHSAQVKQLLEETGRL